MKFEITKEKIIEVAQRYGLEVDFDAEPGLYSGDKKVEVEDLFEDLLGDSQDEITWFTIPEIDLSSKNQYIHVELFENEFRTNTKKDITVGAA